MSFRPSPTALIFLFVICVVILIGVSLMTPMQSASQLKGITFQTVPKGSVKASQKWVIAGSIALVTVVGIIWLYFTG